MDDRLIQVEKEKQEALNQSNNTYEGMLQDNKNLFNQQNNYANEWEKQQNESLDKQLQYNEGLINQQKEIARKNMEDEQKRAKNDYQSYVNPYGNQAESFASNGLLNSGVSETAKLGGYNTYQNRLASANKVMQDAFTQYDSEINQARMSNDVNKAKNALDKLQMQLQYAENYYGNNRDITQNKLANNQSLNDSYFDKYQYVQEQINQEKQREESIRQWEEEMAYQKERDAIADSKWQKEYALSKKSINNSTKKTTSSTKSSSPTALVGTKDNKGNTIGLNPYTGTTNPDTKNGVFSNGYQPNNVGGKLLSSNGMTVGGIFGSNYTSKVTGVDMSGQSVWKTSDGKYYMWEGGLDQYIDITRQVENKLHEEDYLS